MQRIIYWQDLIQKIDPTYTTNIFDRLNMKKVKEKDIEELAAKINSQ